MPARVDYTLGKFGGKRAWRLHLEKRIRDLEDMRVKAVWHSDAHHDGTSYQDAVYAAAYHVEQAIKQLREALGSLS